MRRFGIFTLLIFWAVSIVAQSLCHIERFDTEDGMQQDIVTGVTQGTDGRMWFATQNGLCSYDGYLFTTYKYQQGQAPSLFNNRLDFITVNCYGSIWCQTHDSRVYLFDPTTETFHDVLRNQEEMGQWQHRVKRIYSLPKGVAWVICEDGCSFRVDERYYKEEEGVRRYSAEDNSLKGKRIFTVFQDSKGNEWVLTDKGVNLPNAPENAPDLAIAYGYIAELAGNVYLGTIGNELLCYNLQSGTYTPIEMPEEVTAITCIQVMSKEMLALGTDQGVVIYDPERGEMRTFPIRMPQQPENTVRHIYEDRQGELWVYTSQPGVVRLDIETGERQFLNTGRPDVEEYYFNRVGQIFEDKRGTLWVRPNYGSFSYFDRTTRELKTVNLSASSKEIFNPLIQFFYEDRQGNYWLTSNRGMYKLSTYPSGYAMKQLNENLEQRSLFKDSHRRVWAGSKKGQIRVFAPDGTLQGYLSPQGKIVRKETAFGYNVYSMCRDKEGDIWLATRRNGLFQLKEETPDCYRMHHYVHDPNQTYSLSGNSVFALLCDRKGQLWVGSYGGGLNLVQKKTDGEVRFIHQGNRLCGYPAEDFDNVRCLYETQEGVLLVGTTQGLLSLPTNFRRPEEISFCRNTQQGKGNERLTGNDVINICQHSDGTLYVLTLAGGVNKVLSKELLSEELRFKCYSRTEGLASDMIYSMIEDAGHRLWVVSEYALTRFDPQREIFENYPLIDLGFKQNFSEAMPLLRSNGNLLFGTNMGLLEVQPDVLQKSDYTPGILFTDLRVGTRKIISWGKKEVELQPTERNMRVTFAALDYDRPGNIRYAYRLEGLDEEWNYSDKNRYASYQNLPAGDYTLQVKSTNSDGVWRDNMATLEVHVLPTFWETSWAILLYLLCFVLSAACITSIVLYIYRLRHRVSIEKHLANVKLRFFTDISHELRTPLTLIAGPVSEVLEEEPLSPEARKHLSMVLSNSDYMLDLVNQILDFRKIQNNKMKLLIKRVHPTPILEEIINKFRFMAEENHIALEFHSDAMLPAWIDQGKVEMMFGNLLSNAFKYTHPGKAIAVNLRQCSDKQISISVADEGVGIAPDKLESIFHRFETVMSGSTSQPSSGIGLSLVKRLVELHHGDIKVNSQLGMGSEFIITLPVDYLTYEQDPNAEFVLADGSTTDEAEAMDGDGKEADDERDIVLVVEDNADLRSMLRNILRKQYRVLEAADGEEGLRMAMNHIPDMIISDIMMPVMDGLEMVRRIKEHRDLSHALIVLLTAKGALDDRIHALEQGVDDYITKPFSATYLKVRIASLFQRRRQQQELIIERLAASVPVGTKEKAKVEYNPTIPVIQPYDEQFMQELMTYLEAHLDNSALTIDEIAAHLCLSHSTFKQKLKSIVGIAPVTFVQEIRVKRAAQLLKSQNYSISQVAYMTGFNDPKYFNRCFKKHFGMTASDYLKKMS